jgi:hypothetical protein
VSQWASPGLGKLLGVKVGKEEVGLIFTKEQVFITVFKN